MTAHALLTVAVYVVVLVALGVPLGGYAARVFTGRAAWAQRVIGPIERLLYRLAGVHEDDDMTARRYSLAALLFGLVGLVFMYVLQRFQGALPLNPAGLPNVDSGIAFNTAVSFVTNTNWQTYGGESTMSHLVQMLGLTVQNFLSAATGIAVLVALIRGFSRRESRGVGNFWVDMTRATLYLLIPLSLVLATALAWEGVPQTFEASATVQLVEPAQTESGLVTEQVIPLGPVASQVAIKQLGTNGGGYYNANSAHPLENPTPLSNALQAAAILLVPGALCFMFGALVNDRRQGWVLFAAMLLILVPLAFGCIAAEQAATPTLDAVADTAASADQPGGNMEGKEARFGIVDSALWATATTAASNGSVNAMHDSLTPLGGLVPLWLIQLGEVVFGGVGSGLYGMLMFAVVAVFIAGLMVGRTPEYLGKKIETFEMKMASVAILAPSAAVLLGTAIACLTPSATAALGNPGAHGFSELLYAFSSAANNNGSAFAGLAATSPFYTVGTAFCMLAGRSLVMLPVLAVAGSLAAKRPVPATAGTLPTHSPLFVLLLVGTVFLVGALTFVPALALGPIVEHLHMMGH